MAIRVAGKPPVAPPPVEDPEVPEVPEVPEEMMEQDEAVSEPMLPMDSEPGKVDQKIVRYMTKDMGPFICANCKHFQDDGSCEIVSGMIDPEGVCIIYCPPKNDLEGVAEDVAPLEELEEPVEEPVEEEEYE